LRQLYRVLHCDISICISSITQNVSSPLFFSFLP
jgi:hypothetical protein